MKKTLSELWPELSFKEGKETYDTIHMWTQIIGKIKLSVMPWINHSWQVALTVTSNGFTTGELAFNEKHFQIHLDFTKHQLQISTNSNKEITFDLRALSVAQFYRNILHTLNTIGIKIRINPFPNEVVDPVPFHLDHRNTYIPGVAESFHMALLKAHKVFTEFRAGFIGKCSPVHFFWGSFDLAVSRFSGRKAPLHPGGVPNLPDWVVREAYSHEVCSCGFWMGNEALPYASFYSYVYPEPTGYNSALVKPETAGYNKDFREFILQYNEVRNASNPSLLLMDFLQSTYNAAADFAGWDRQNLEKNLSRNLISGEIM